MIPDMNNLLPVVGMLTLAALTPGPNNMIALEAGARGPRAVLNIILGTVAGSLLLLSLAALGVGALLAALPALSAGLTILGGAYLAWLGLRLAWPRTTQRGAHPVHPQPATVLAMALFQLANPKAWLLVGTAVTLLPGAGNLLSLTLAIIVITTACLLLWALAGAATQRAFQDPMTRRRFDICMGLALAASASWSVLHAV
jgi:threonine/homoserine/homoserine lactone efflux protein